MATIHVLLEPPITGNWLKSQGFFLDQLSRVWWVRVADSGLKLWLRVDGLGRCDVKITHRDGRAVDLDPLESQERISALWFGLTGTHLTTD